MRQLLVWPECISYTIVLHHHAVCALPFPGIVSYFSHIHREPCLVAEFNVVFDPIYACFTSITMAGVHNVIIESPIRHRLKVSIPLRSADNDNMVSVNFPDCFSSPDIQWLKTGIQFIQIIFEIWSNGFIAEFISENSRFIYIMRSNPPPY